METFGEKLHDKDMLHFRNLGLIFFQESMQMNASEFLQKMDSPPSPFPNSNSFSSLSPSPLPKRTKFDIPAQSIIDLTDSHLVHHLNQSAVLTLLIHLLHLIHQLKKSVILYQIHR